MPYKLVTHAQRLRATTKLLEDKAYDVHNRRYLQATRMSKAFRSSARWQHVRSAHLAQHPACADPFGLHGPLLAAANQVDHIIPLEAGGAQTDSDNLQGLCTRCHARKSQRERLLKSGSER